MGYFVYVLQSLKDKGFYIGITTNPTRRLKYHNLGTNRSTKTRVPFKLVYYEEFSDKRAALKREKQIKSYKGGNAFKRLISAGL